MAVLALREFWASLLGLLVVCIQVKSSYALTAQYCSTQNTGGGASPNYSIYQSNGLCHDACLSSYAFAIVQGRNCWCSNYAPAAQVSTSNCDTPCPGYPTELCGNEDQSLFGYIALNVAPSGTLGSASSSTAASASRSSLPPSTSKTTTLAKPSESTQSVEEAVTSSSSSVILPSTTLQVTSSAIVPQTTASNSASSPKAAVQPKTSSQTPTLVTNVQVVTQSGQIITQTITTTPISPSANQESRKSGIAPGYIAAAVIAGLLGLVFILAGIWLVLRRKQDRDGEEGFQSGSPRDMQRNISVHSKAGLLGNRSGVPAINTRLSGLPLMDDGVTPVSPVSERRKSQPLIWDQRLNPNALMANENGSKTSLNTIDDHRDYGRTLQVTNPDPMRTSFS